MTRSMFTPISAAASASCAVARIARPVRVRRMNASSATTISNAVADDDQVAVEDAQTVRSRTRPAREASAGSSPASTPRHTCTRVRQEERHPDRADQVREPRRTAPPQRTVRDPFDRRPRAGRTRASPGSARATRYIAPCRLPDAAPSGTIASRTRNPVEHAAHEHLGVREVDQLQDAVDERVADRDRARTYRPSTGRRRGGTAGHVVTQSIMRRRNEKGGHVWPPFAASRASLDYSLELVHAPGERVLAVLDDVHVRHETLTGRPRACRSS